MHAVYVDKDGFIKAWPAIYIAMDNKLETTYDFLLKLIKYISKKHDYEIDPQFIITDFEDGEMNALKHAFPSALVIACWFHYSARIQTWFQKNTGPVIFNNLEANLVKSYLILLAWIPPKFVIAFWELHLINEIKKVFNTQLAGRLIKYVNRTWFGKYNIQDWNIFGKPTWTNNAIENINKILNELFGYHCSKIEFLIHAYKINFETLNDWFKFMNCKKTYPPQKSWKKKKKEEFIRISQKYWPQNVIDSKDPSHMTTIKHAINYLIEMNDVRVKFNPWFRNMNKNLSIPLSTQEFLSSKSLTKKKK